MHENERANICTTVSTSRGDVTPESVVVGQLNRVYATAFMHFAISAARA